MAIAAPPVITSSDIVAALRALGVEPSDTLFVHADVRCALRVAGDSIERKVDTLIDALDAAVPRGVLAMPTFTYSFCRGEQFDVDATPSTVGLLSERFRRRPGVRRTVDPIFSAALRGTLPDAWERDLFEPGDQDCFGERSVFALLRESRAKLAFAGAGFEYCTFVHHVEQQLRVPYRYPKDFTGKVVSGGAAHDVRARYFVRRLDEDVETLLGPLGDALLAGGGARRAVLAGGLPLIVAEAAAVEAVACRRLADNPDFLLERGHPGGP